MIKDDTFLHTHNDGIANEAQKKATKTLKYLR